MFRLVRRRREVALAALAVLLAFALLGARGIWDPDEGRYTNVAINMVESGDWLTPMRHDDVGHWTKPPLTYWAVGASIEAFGLTPFAARLPIALAFLACVGLVFQLARRLAPGTEQVAALAYATMLDMARYGLRLHLDAEIEKISLAPLGAQDLDPEFDEDLATELAESASEGEVVFVARAGDLPALLERMHALGYDAGLRGAPYEGRVFFTPIPLSSTGSDSTAALPQRS